MTSKYWRSLSSILSGSHMLYEDCLPEVLESDVTILSFNLRDVVTPWRLLYKSITCHQYETTRLTKSLWKWLETEHQCPITWTTISWRYRSFVTHVVLTNLLLHDRTWTRQTNPSNLPNLMRRPTRYTPFPETDADVTSLNVVTESDWHPVKLFVTFDLISLEDDPYLGYQGCEPATDRGWDSRYGQLVRRSLQNYLIFRPTYSWLWRRSTSLTLRTQTNLSRITMTSNFLIHDDIELDRIFRLDKRTHSDKKNWTFRSSANPMTWDSFVFISCVCIQTPAHKIGSWKTCVSAKKTGGEWSMYRLMILHNYYRRWRR